MENVDDPKLSHMIVTNRTEENIEMAGVDYVTKSGEIASCDGGTSQRCIASYFPEQIIFNILLCLPADVIYDVMRYVCRMWFNIIKSQIFIRSHLQKSTSGLIIQRSSSLASGYFAKMEKCDVEVKELKFQYSTVMGSCNGLVLFYDEKRSNFLYVANPVTKQQLKLPPFRHGQHIISVGFAYANSSGVYKVVSATNGPFQILTVGVDKSWRLVDVSHLTSTSVKAFNDSPIAVGGYVHWANPQIPFVLTFDVETETFREFPRPKVFLNGLSKFLAMESSLSLLTFEGECTWEIWVLEDPQDGKWEKLRDIDLKGEREFRPIVSQPIGWLQCRELVVYHVSYTRAYCIVYNVETGGFHSLEFCSGFDSLSSTAHVNSLVPLP